MVAPTDTQPPPVTSVTLDFPAPYVLLVTINRPAQMNSLSFQAAWEMERVWEWMDEEPQLRVGIITGAGKKAFCSGMDIKDRLEMEKLDELALAKAVSYPPTGFAGLTRRTGKKPIIAACNGHAHGGGFEIILNSDLVIAAEHADFKLPDSARGTGALCGGLPRLARQLTLQRAMLLALTTYTLPAKEAMEWGLVQKIVPADDLIKEAVKMGTVIARMSPDSIIVNRAGVRQGWETASVEHASTLIWDNYAKKLMLGENAIEGMQAFKEKRRPVWKPSKL